MTLRRFVDRSGWEKWIDVMDPPPFAYRLVDDSPLERFAPMASRRVDVRYREFILEEVMHADLERRELVYVEDGNWPSDAMERFGSKYPSLAREHAYAEALAAIARAAEVRSGDIGAMLNAPAQLDEIQSILATLPPKAIGRSPDRCYAHEECRRIPSMGFECKRRSA